MTASRLRNSFLLACAAAGLTQACWAQSWTPQTSGTNAALRGISAVSDQIAWASGTRGTFLKTTDGGATWTASSVEGAANVDFRDIHAVSDKVAFLLSSGDGPLSRVYKTTDGGVSWTSQLINGDPKGFFDAIAFWDESHGILMGDPVNGRFTIYTTRDGQTWQRMKGPEAHPQEAAFAASGTCLTVRGNREAWFATGGPGGPRVFHTTDGGETWSAATAPLRNDSEGAGVFSLAFSDASTGVAVGGDYTKPADPSGTAAVTSDGGKTWTAASVSGYRSAVAYLPGKKLWIATGTSGSDVSTDGGKTWREFDKSPYNAISVAGDTAWAVGPRGAIAKLALD